jgi:hypothetical protein
VHLAQQIRAIAMGRPAARMMAMDSMPARRTLSILATEPAGKPMAAPSLDSLS